jgi:hypothetical protein
VATGLPCGGLARRVRLRCTATRTDRRRIMDLKGASEAMTQRAQQNALENKQKEQENEEQLKALETFGKALQKAGQI